MKLLFTLFITTIFGLTALATHQAPDRIIFNGKNFYLLDNPLETYFDRNPDKRPKSEILTTALYRGYIATFEIRDSQLFLKDIEIQYRDTTNKTDYDFKFKSVMSEVFPDQENIKITWLTGIIFISELIEIEPIKEKYTLLKINKGDLIKDKKINGRKYRKIKKRQFKALIRNDKFETETK